MADYKRIKLEDIDVDWDLQPRANGLDQSHVDELADAYRGDRAVEPPTVWRIADGWDETQFVYRLSQGFHRFQAMTRAGLTEAKFLVRHGTADECAIDAACSNRDHGLKRTNADKRRAVEILLKRLPKESDRAIAERAGVHHDLVASCRRLADSASGFLPPSERIGLDGVLRPATQPPRPVSPPPPPPATPNVAAATRNVAAPPAPPVQPQPPAAPAPDTVLCPHCGGNGRIPKPPPVQPLFNAPGMPTLPPELDEPDFILAWESWLHERKKRKQPVTVQAARLQLRDLAAHGVKVAVETIETSIKNGWIGLFPNKVNGNGKARNFAAEAEADQMAQYAADAFGGAHQ